MRTLIACALVATWLCGCAATAPTADRWPGTWQGPEGTFLRIDGTGGGAYRLTIRNLDGPREFAGRAAGERIEFVRDGSAESLRRSDGRGTGMKWLADKRDCVTVRPGEGFCRD